MIRTTTVARSTQAQIPRTTTSRARGEDNVDCSCLLQDCLVGGYPPEEGYTMWRFRDDGKASPSESDDPIDTGLRAGVCCRGLDGGPKARSVPRVYE
mmetsp:Transcript_24579/g.57268  ORF Transcript_24579/g.57268 Transcript_24579/m.57268 type:complete len:97 (+) Transcript_24579:1762-2052(+)